MVNDRNSTLEGYTDKDMQVLSQLAYIDFNSGMENMTIQEILDNDNMYSDLYSKFMKKYQDDDGEYYDDDLTEKRKVAADEFFSLIKNSEKYSNWKVINVDNQNATIGFYAVTLKGTNDEDILVGFRGSESIDNQFKEDWLETDFMLMNGVTNDQFEATKAYMEKVATLCDDNSKVYFCGHSLGGALASHAIITAPDNLFSKITQVYNLDGPGVSDEYLQTYTDKISERSWKISHYQWSAIGAILNSLCGENYITIKTTDDIYDSEKLIEMFTKHDTCFIDFDKYGHFQLGNMDDLANSIHELTVSIDLSPGYFGDGLVSLVTKIATLDETKQGKLIKEVGTLGLIGLGAESFIMNPTLTTVLALGSILTIKTGLGGEIIPWAINALSNVVDFIFDTSDNVILGTSLEDLIEATPYDDLIYSGSGDDIVRGCSGDDLIYGDHGNDHIEGGEGDDTLCGEDGDDTVIGDDGEDYIYGGSGDDEIVGGNDNDYLFGEDGKDTISGDDGNDYIEGGKDRDIIFGGTGNDVILGGIHDSSIEDTIASDSCFASGDDEIHGGAGEDYLFGGDGNDTIYGDDDNDIIYGEEDDDELHGGKGDDEIHGGDGIDVLWGDAGKDKLFGDNDNDEIHGGYGNDELFGGEGDDYVYGDAGDDYIEGGNGTNHLYGGIGKDTIVGGEDKDIMFGEDGDDTLIGGNGTNYMYGGIGNDTFTGGDDYDHIEGGEGDDTMNGGNGSNHMYGQEGIDHIYGGNDDDYIDGGEGDDHLYGGNGNNTIYGREGDDIIYDGDNASHIYGNEGNDTIRAGGGDDIIDGGTGDDYIQDDHGNDTIVFKAGYGRDTISDAAGYNTIQLSGLDTSSASYSRSGNDLTISFGADAIILKQYYDFHNFNIDGTDVSDLINSLHGSDNADWMNVANSNGDSLYGEGGNDNLTGNSGNDTLYGGSGNDYLYGNDGDDILDGDEGDDYLCGGNGNDTYIFGKSYGHDTIEDWGGSSRVVFNDVVSNEVTVSNLWDSTLEMTINGTDDKLTVNGYKWNQGGYTFEFADGTTGTVNKDTWELEMDETVQMNADQLSDLYDNDALLSSEMTESNAQLYQSNEAISITEEDETVSDQTDIQVMILTENMSAFAAEDNISSGIDQIDISADIPMTDQLLVGTPIA